MYNVFDASSSQEKVELSLQHNKYNLGHLFELTMELCQHGTGKS